MKTIRLGDYKGCRTLLTEETEAMFHLDGAMSHLLSLVSWSKFRPEKRQEEPYIRRGQHLKTGVSVTGTVYQSFFAKSSFDLSCCQELETIKDRCQEHLLFSDREKYECIVSHPSFWHQCLYPTMLDNVAYLYRKAGHPGVKKRNDINAKRRYIAYRQFTVWIHGRCGYKYRRHIPQCVTKKIRTTFPSDRYVGYEEAPDSNLSGDEIDEDEDL